MGEGASDLRTALEVLAELAPRLRAAGCTAVTVGSVSAVLAPPGVGPLALSPLSLAPAPSAVEDDDPEADDLPKEAKEEARLVAAWRAHWIRMTRSSGAPVPKFPGVLAAREFLGGS